MEGRGDYTHFPQLEETIVNEVRFSSVKRGSL